MTRPRDRVAPQRAEHHRLRPAGSRDSSRQMIVGAGFDRRTKRRRRRLGTPAFMQQSAALDANQDGPPRSSGRSDRPAPHPGQVSTRGIECCEQTTTQPAAQPFRRYAPDIRHVAAQAGGAPRNLRHRYGQRSQPRGRRRWERSACRGLDHSACIQARAMAIRESGSESWPLTATPVSFHPNLAGADPATTCQKAQGGTS